MSQKNQTFKSWSCCLKINGESYPQEDYWKNVSRLIACSCSSLLGNWPAYCCLIRSVRVKARKVQTSSGGTIVCYFLGWGFLNFCILHPYWWVKWLVNFYPARLSPNCHNWQRNFPKFWIFCFHLVTTH